MLRRFPNPVRPKLMHSPLFRLHVWLAPLAVFLLVGCGPPAGPKTYRLTGTVTYKGEPVPVGNVSLSPDSAQGNQGPGATTGIQNGKFETAPDQGHIGGHYILYVNGYDGVPVESGEGGMDPAGKPLFSAYQTKVELPAADHEIKIEVP